MSVKVKTTGLGRGLDALFSTNETTTESSTEKDKEFIVPIKLSLIDINKNQPRKNFDPHALEELAASIKENGLLQPIAVIKTGERYEIVAGERRYRAFRLLGEQQIPAIIKNLSNRQAMELALIENLQREDLNPLEEAEAMSVLIQKFNMTQQELADKIGKSRTAVTNALRLMGLSQELKKLINDQAITAGHARAILSLEQEKERNKLAQLILQGDLNVRQAEKLAASWNKTKTEKAKKERDTAFADLEVRLRQTLGTKTFIKGSEKKGKIEIEYYSKDELERILELILQQEL